MSRRRRFRSRKRLIRVIHTGQPFKKAYIYKGSSKRHAIYNLLQRFFIDNRKFFDVMNFNVRGWATALQIPNGATLLTYGDNVMPAPHGAHIRNQIEKAGRRYHIDPLSTNFQVRCNLEWCDPKGDRAGLYNFSSRLFVYPLQAWHLSHAKTCYTESEEEFLLAISLGVLPIVPATFDLSFKYISEGSPQSKATNFKEVSRLAMLYENSEKRRIETLNYYLERLEWHVPKLSRYTPHFYSKLFDFCIKNPK